MASIIGQLLGSGAGQAAQGIGAGIADVVKSLYTTDGETLDKQTALKRLEMTPLLNQLAINLAEASNRSVWVAGWRPFIGWVCGTALLYNFVLRDLIVWAFAAWAPTMPLPPTLDLGSLMTILLGLLGLGGLRTVEKVKGVSK